MNVDPVLIEDDDVDMEPVVILDEDDENIISEKVVGVETVETIVLDDESPIITEGTVKNTVINKPTSTNKSETSFVNNLKNNRLMDKIVQRCLNMENSTGMPRVIYKTVLPLYRDTNNSFKESESFRALLKKTYKLLMRDPDHKFLHIKTLCEELKSGGLRRKVPFVTLATNLKHNGYQWDHQELTSSSREINQNNEENRQTHEVLNTKKNYKRKKVTGTKRKAKISKSCAVNTKDRIKTRSVAHAEKKKTDIIELDDSDNESVDRAENDDGQNDVIIIEETEPSDQRNDNVNTVLHVTVEAKSKEGNEVAQETVAAESKKGNQVVQKTLEAVSKKSNQVIKETLEAKSKKGNQVVQEPLEAESKKSNQVIKETLEAKSKKGNQVVQEPLEAESKKGNQVVQETVEAESKKGNQVVQKTLEPVSNKGNQVIEGTLEAESKKGNQVVQQTLEADCNIENKVVEETIEEDSNKENNADNGKSSDNEMDYELLIPKNHVEVLPIEYQVPHYSTSDKERIARLEQQIENLKQKIDKLEETEVITESPFGSPYYLCSKYKENVVACYEQICAITGNCEDLVKRREIRVIVAEGHPPGPAKRLEKFLNCKIDRTGAVEFPDFSDVVKCVVESNLNDNLAWNRQQVMQEALVLFRQCGQALRKRRQMREYRDLLSLIRDNEEIDDPAEKDPILLAKLEENKLIAKIKEEEILERYVRMENNALPRVGVPQVGNAVEFESNQDSSGSDSDTESEHIITLPNIPTSTVNNQPDKGECSRSNISLSLLHTNNIINNHCNTGLSSKTHDDNHLVVNSMLLNVLTAPKTTQKHVEGTATIMNQCATGESSIFNDAISNNDSGMLPTNIRNFTPDTIHNECETFECSGQGEIFNSNLELTFTETKVGFNNATINENSDMSSINNMRCVENTKITADDEPCNVNDVQDQVSSTTDDIEQNCDSSISTEGVNVKSEDVKREPLDVQNMLDELGDSFVCQVFDIEDPFLVIEISSDGFTDDEL